MNEYEMLNRVNELMKSCISCERCRLFCGAYSVGGVDPVEVMNGGNENIETCILCGNCSRTCRKSDPATVMRILISMAQNLEIPQVYHETGYSRPPVSAGPIPEWYGDEMYVMPGCVVKSLALQIECAAATVMRKLGIAASELPGDACCLHPPAFINMTKLEKRQTKQRIYDSADGRPIVALCASCKEEMDVIGDNIMTFLTFIAERIHQIPRFKKTIKVGMEPGCSSEKERNVLKDVLQKMNCEIVNRDHGCCGKSSPISPLLMEKREKECEGADIIVVLCPRCFTKYDEVENGIPVVHLTELVALAFGDQSSLEYHKIPVKL